MKKVLFSIPNLNGGGAEKVLTTILKNIDSQRFQVTLLLVFYEGIYIKDIPDYVEVKYLFKTKNSFITRAIYKIFRFVSPRIIYKTYIKEKYDVEIAFLEGITTKLISGSQNKKSKKIAWVHTDLSSNHLTRHYFKNIENELEHYKKFNKVVCVSNDVKNGFEKTFKYHENLEVIYNPIDSKQILEDAKGKSINNTGLTICTVGRLIEVKGYDRLIRVHSKLLNEGLKHKLIIVGTGPLEKELKELCTELKLKESVTFTGFQNNPYKFIRDSDIFVSSSLMEGFPLVVCEALVLEKPVICTRTSGPIEILDGGKYGLLVENTEEGIYKGLKEFIKNDQSREYYKEMAKKRKPFFDLESVLARVYSILE